jgi:hypothetical protein
MPRLVVLNACESATSGGTDMFSGTAATLVRGGVSAVTAMQFEISDAAAIAFCRGFYAAIGRGRGVDEAVRSGRVSILGLGDGCLEWITPSLYLRGRETHLFDVSQSHAPVPAPAPVAEPEVVVDPVRVAPPVPFTPPAVPFAPAPAEPLWPTEPAPAYPGETAPVPEVPRPSPVAYVAAHPPVYPDRLDDLWTVAKRIGWTDRPLKSETRVLAQSLTPEDLVVGVTRLPFAFTQSCALVVTSQSLFLGTDSPNGRGWLDMAREMPGEYQIARDQVRIPLTDVNWVDGGSGKLVLMLRGRRISISVFGGGEDLRDRVSRYIAQARGQGTGA